MDYSGYSDTYGGDHYSLKGWDFIRYQNYGSSSEGSYGSSSEGSYGSSSEGSYGSSSGGPYGSSSEWLVLIGSILMIASAMIAFLKYLMGNESKLAAVLLSAAAFIGALLAIIGTLIYISDMNTLKKMYSMFGGELTGINLTSTGVIVSTVFAFLGIICVVIMFLQARTRFSVIKQSNTIERSSDIGSPPFTAPGSVRSYYEKKAVDFAKGTAPVEDKTTMAAIPPMPKMPPISAATVPLPPLPPVIDDASAQECFVRAGELETAGERDKAVEQYTKAIRLNAKHTTAYFKRGMLLMEMGFKPAAVADFRRVIDIADNPELTDIAKANIVKLG